MNDKTNTEPSTATPPLHYLRQITSITLGIVGITVLMAGSSNSEIGGYPPIFAVSGLMILAGALLSSPDVMPKVFGKNPPFCDQPVIALVLALMTVPLAYGTYYTLYESKGLHNAPVPIPDREALIERVHSYKENDLLDAGLSKAMVYAEYRDPEINSLIRELHLLKREKRRAQEFSSLKYELRKTPTYMVGKRYQIYSHLLGYDPDEILYTAGYKRFQKELFNLYQFRHMEKYSNVIGPPPHPGTDGHYDIVQPYLAAKHPDGEILINKCDTPNPTDSGWLISCDVEMLKGNHMYRDDHIFFTVTNGELDDTITHATFEKVL